jgi:NAD(P)-dependent dehydrogenase (short-subunit alcohol dehydrogenase family)
MSDLKIVLISYLALTLTPMLKEAFEGGDKLSSSTVMGGMTMVQPEHVAEVVTWLLSDEASKVWGANIPVGGAPP